MLRAAVAGPHVVSSLVLGQRRAVQINFGKHKGADVAAVPRDYLEWLSANSGSKLAADPALNAAIQQILGRPGSPAQKTPYQGGQGFQGGFQGGFQKKPFQGGQRFQKPGFSSFQKFGNKSGAGGFGGNNYAARPAGGFNKSWGGQKFGQDSSQSQGNKFGGQTRHSFGSRRDFTIKLAPVSSEAPVHSSNYWDIGSFGEGFGAAGATAIKVADAALGSGELSITTLRVAGTAGDDDVASLALAPFIAKNGSKFGSTTVQILSGDWAKGGSSINILKALADNNVTPKRLDVSAFSTSPEGLNNFARVVARLSGTLEELHLWRCDAQSVETLLWELAAPDATLRAQAVFIHYAPEALASNFTESAALAQILGERPVLTAGRFPSTQKYAGFSKQ